MQITNKHHPQLIANAGILKQIPVLLEKHHGIQMSNIWKFGISTGIRLNDMLPIKLSNISGGGLFVGLNKIIETPMYKTISLSLEAVEIINSIRKEHPSSEYLFQSHRSRNVTNKKPSPLTRQAVNRAFKDVGEILGIPLTPYTMRQVYICQVSS